ncbi:MAG TPA: CPBP family intramembrane metalloprotease [Bacteroides sp.]|nr:CPBP family intramembrane metalloprotease [Bacteroides sp.]
MPADPPNKALIIALIWSVAGFSCYYLLSQNDRFARKFRHRVPHLDYHIIQVLFQRMWGVIFLGILSVLVIRLFLRDPLAVYGLGFQFHRPPPWWILLSFPLIIAVSRYHASSSKNLALYPQFRIQTWTPGILFINGISWIMFLVAYEFLFRGFLLFGALSVMDPQPAVLLNCVLYAVAHLYKGPLETIGAIPMGVLLCYLTILTGNIWTAVCIHSFMALTNEWMSIRAHPGMELQRSVRPRAMKSRNQ